MNRAERIEIFLRVDLDAGAGVLATHTLEVGPDSLMVAVTERLAPGTLLSLMLSFPRFIEPFAVTGRVVRWRAANGHGSPAAAEIDFVAPSAEVQERLASLATEGTTSVAPKRRSLAPRPRYRFLLVEDNAFIRDVFSFAMTKFFAGRKAEVALDYAADGAEAWELLRTRSYDLALVDHYLPTLTGCDLIARIRADARLSDIPIVAMSVGGAEIQDASLAAGADIFLDKPVLSRSLFSTLEKLTLQDAVQGDA